ncbi:MAG: O-antigen ligase family protein [Gemmatimonadales bacterium]
MIAYAALWIFVFTLPWETVLVIPGVGVITKVTGALALGCALLAVVVSGRVRRLHGLHVAALLFLAWAAAGLLGHRMQEIPNKFWTYAQLLLVLWMIWELAPSRSRQLGLLTAYVFGAYISAFDTIRIFRTQAEVLRRYAAGGADANDVAMMLALALPMAWYLGMTYQKPLLRWACRGYLPVGLLAIGLTGSRGGMVATVVALLIVPWTLTQLSPGRRAVALVLIVISGAIAIAYVPDRLKERLATTRTEVEGGRLGGRVKLLQAGVKAFALKPVIGYGTSGFKKAVSPWLNQEESQAAHNSFLSVLVEQGMVGLVIYLTMFFAVFLAVLNLPPLERRFALVLLATLVTSMLPLTSEDSKRVWFILAALVGLSQTYVPRIGGAAWQPRPGQAAPRERQLDAARRREPLATPVRNTDRGPIG